MKGKQTEIAAVRARAAAESGPYGDSLGGGPFGASAAEASVEYLPGVPPRLPGEETVATGNPQVQRVWTAVYELKEKSHTFLIVTYRTRLRSPMRRWLRQLRAAQVLLDSSPVQP